MSLRKSSNLMCLCLFLPKKIAQRNNLSTVFRALLSVPECLKFILLYRDTKDERPQSAAAKKLQVPEFVKLGRPTRSSIDARTRGLAIRLNSAVSSASKLLRTEDLVRHLLECPETRSIAVQEGAIRTLLRFERKCRDEALKGTAREALALLGYVPPPRGTGIRMLSIDGGGTRLKL